MKDKNSIEKIINIIKDPIITDKTTKNIENNVYYFKVDKKSNKNQIKKAIEYIFEVKVYKISTMNSAPKMTTVGKFKGNKKQYKKAIITLQKSYKINIFEEN
uniref:Large ribosomal subunit protein uL23c n=1 Tax=Ophidocladus simpliciusculus TaxID=1261574 RepID=A0A1Z1MJ05_9FLOR|nr:ribosomal protein L23 [Ophidocladus simpliciusculus]ARW66033.1 ribosomal protein L23 [Ophidocladus simpliciusculus]